MICIYYHRYLVSLVGTKCDLRRFEQTLVIDSDKTCDLRMVNLYENYLRKIVWKKKIYIIDRVNIFGL